MVFYETSVKNYTLAPGGLRVATDEADSDNKFSPEDYGDEDKENNEADVEFEFETFANSEVRFRFHTKSGLNSTQGDADSRGKPAFWKDRRAV